MVGQRNFYSRLSNKKIAIAGVFVESISNRNDWYELADAKFGKLWDEFKEWWKKGCGETPTKMSFYAPHNVHWLAEWSTVAHPEIWAAPN